MSRTVSTVYGVCTLVEDHEITGVDDDGQPITWTEQAVTQTPYLVEEVIDDGGGNGRHVFYRENGTVDRTEQITGLPVDAPSAPTVSDALGKLKTATSLAKVREAAADLETALTAKGIT